MEERFVLGLDWVSFSNTLGCASLNMLFDFRNDIDHPNVGKRGSYPSVAFFPSDDKENPIKFEETHGDDVAEALMEFLSIYGSG